MKLRDKGITTENEKQLEKKLSKSLKALENQSQGGGNHFHLDFASAVMDAVDKKESPHIKLHIALTQAGTVFAKFIIDRKANAIVGNNGNFPVLSHWWEGCHPPFF